MNPIFGAGPSLPLRFSLAFVISFITITYDVYTDSSQQIRSYLNTFVSPVIYVANLPQQALDTTFKYATSKQTLLDENETLRALQLMQNEKLQRYNMLMSENAKLRALLQTNLRTELKKSVAEIMAVASNPFSQNVMIDKGSSHRVYESQPVLDDLGVVGQVVNVANTTSRVILITDQTHSIPIRIARNDVRAILSGTGDINKMALINLPHGTDVKIGDMLITSGLGEIFPDGHPVAKVINIFPDESQPFMNIVAQPIARLDRLKHVLLLWPNESEQSAAKKQRERNGEE